MGHHVYEIEFVEIPHCEECWETVESLFSCPECRDGRARVSFRYAPYEQFMRLKSKGFYCGSCHVYYAFAGYDMSNDRYLFTRNSHGT